MSRKAKRGLRVVVRIVVSIALLGFAARVLLQVWWLRLYSSKAPQAFVVPQPLPLPTRSTDSGISLVGAGWRIHVPWSHVENRTTKKHLGTEYDFVEFEHDRRLLIHLDPIGGPDYRDTLQCASDKQRAKCEDLGGPRVMESPFFLARAVLGETPEQMLHALPFYQVPVLGFLLALKTLTAPSMIMAPLPHAVFWFDNGRAYGFQDGAPPLDPWFAHVEAWAPGDRFLRFHVLVKDGPPLRQEELSPILASLEPTDDAAPVHYLSLASDEKSGDTHH